jgi:hypothetical protein
MTTLRDLEQQSIRTFVQSAADEGYLSGRVLDYGCGRMPYRGIVNAGCDEYVGYDRAEFPANLSGEDVGEYPFWPSKPWDAILCTQVVQYIPFPDLFDLLAMMATEMREHSGRLILTYPTNWPEVEPEDLHRFTKAGMERLLTEVGFEIIRHDWRHGFTVDGMSFAAGYGCIAHA